MSAETAPVAAEVRAKRAVVYLRVSTMKQAQTDDADGYSLPAQREACLRKAEQLGAEVTEIYIDRGESAKTAERPQFQRMLARIRDHRDVDYVILDKIDRFARNRRDDANILFELRMAGAQLVSVKENVDETPSGQLLHAIMAGIAEFYSKNLATETMKGMTQKAILGGTPGRAPIGYLNTRRRGDSGQEIRTVMVDPDRARLVQWAFEEALRQPKLLRQDPARQKRRPCRSPRQHPPRTLVHPARRRLPTRNGRQRKKTRPRSFRPEFENDVSGAP